MNEQLIETIAATAELCRAKLSQVAASMLAEDLSKFPEHQVLAALAKCRRGLERGEVFGTEAVVKRIEDGRPSADEAWAMIPKSEAETVIWTEEMSQAWGIAAPLLAVNDQYGARKAFTAAYERLVAEARHDATAVKVWISPGHDAGLRETTILRAVDKGLITRDYAAKVLPGEPMTPEGIRLLKQAGAAVKQLPRA